MYMYIWIYIYIYGYIYIRMDIDTYGYIYIYMASAWVLPGEVEVNCAGPIFSVFWDASQIATWLMRFVSNTHTHRTLNPKT